MYNRYGAVCTFDVFEDEVQELSALYLTALNEGTSLQQIRDIGEVLNTLKLEMEQLEQRFQSTPASDHELVESFNKKGQQQYGQYE